MSIFTRLRPNKMTKKQKIILAAAVAFVLIVIIRSGGNATPVEEREDRLEAVTLLDLASYAQDQAVVRGTGEVESLEQVELRSEVSSRVTGVQVTLGQEVFAGQLIATFDSAQLAAQRRQAEADLANALAARDSAVAGLEGQQSRLQDLENGARPEEVAIQEALVTTAQDAYRNALSDTKNLLEGVLNTIQDMIYTDVDSMYSDPRTDDPTLTFDSFNSTGRTTVQGQRALINDRLENWGTLVDGVTADRISVDAALVASERELLYLQEFLETLTDVIVEEIGLTDTEKNTNLGIVTVARSTVSTQLGLVQSQIQNISNKDIAVAQANEQLALVRAGATREQLATQEAAVRQAQTSLSSQDAGIARAQATIDSINAQLAKNAIRTPIRGTVATLPVRTGELVSPGALVASIVNTSGLQVKAFIDSSDLTRIRVGATTTIDTMPVGKVTNIAPSIDPITRKVEVIIALSNEEIPFVVGQFVDIEIEKAVQASDSIRLPLSAIRVSTDGSKVYTVNQDNIVESHEVSLGRVVGETVEVLSGLEDVEQIIRTARGIAAGDEVTIR